MKTKLIALIAITAASLAVAMAPQDIVADVIGAYPAGVAVGDQFEVESTTAEALLTHGLAKLAEDSIAGTGSAPPQPAKAPSSAKPVRMRVLVDCVHGKANDLVTVAKADAEAAEEAGQGDTSKAAIAYAATLTQNQPAAA